MLLSDVRAKTVRDRTPMALWVGGGLAVVSLFMLWVASGLEQQLADLLDELPEVFTSLLGEGGGNYVVGELFGLIGPIAILVVGISGGVHALAREERDRTADLLLAQPVTRRHVVVAKAGVLVLDVFLACAVFGVGASAASVLVGPRGFGPGDALAGTVHLFFLGLAFGMIALAVANATGSTGVGLAVTTGLAVLSSLTAGLLPLVDGMEDGARLSPWHYYNGADPVGRGVDAGDLGVLAAIAAVAFTVGVVVVEHRDIGSRRAGRGLSLPAVGALTRPRMSGVFTKSLWERTTLVTVSGGSLAVLAVLVSLMFDGLQATMSDFSRSLPAGIGELIGSADLGTPVGWIQAEMMSMLVPLVVVAVGVVMGVNAIAGEDARRTLGLLVALPVTRRRIVLEKAAAMAAGVVAVAALCWAGMAVGSAVAGLGLDIGNVTGAMVHVSLLGVLFGGIGLALGAATSPTVALRTTLALVVAAYLGEWLLRLDDRLAGFAVLSPWHYLSAAEPLVNGADPLHLAVLATGAVIAVGTAVPLFERRELQA